MTKELRPGDRAPSFKIPTDAGSEISNVELKGKPFVVYFYPKDDTSGCTKEAISFTKEKKKFDSIGVKIIGISKDSVVSHEKFKKKHKLGITLASDSDVKVAQAFGVWVEKSLYGRSYMGMERATFLIDGNGVVKHVWRKVKVPGHADAVLEAACAL
ncbi:MAG TPA: thioredoxin-dependent thiol peroxidase [Rhizomicrobium sp.]